MNPLPLILALSVHAEIVRLGHDSYLEREDASARLLAMMPLSTGQLNLACSHKDLEIARRAELVLERFTTVNQSHFLERGRQLRCPGYRLAPWIDSLPLDYPDRDHVIAHYLSAARTQHDIKVGSEDRYSEYRVATMLFCADRLREGKPEQEVIDLYARMAQQELAWLKRNGPLWASVLEQAAPEANRD